MHKPSVIIIAGGANTRFFPFHTASHKSAVTLLGKPLVVRTIENLLAHDFTELTVVISPKDAGEEGVQQIITTAFPTQKIRFVLQPTAKGMGDAVLTAYQEDTPQFAVVAPYHFNAGEVLEQMLALGQQNAVCSTTTNEPWECGMLAIDDDGRVTKIVEKPAKGTEPSNEKIQAIYLLSDTFVSLLKKEALDEYNFEAALNQLFKVADVRSLHLTEALPSLKYPWHLFEFQAQLFQRMPSFRDPSAQVAATAVIDESTGPVHLAAGVKVGHASRIFGPCYLGQDVHVGDFALVRNSSLEAASSVGVFSEIARTIMLKKSSMHSGFIGDSLIGNDVKIGAGIITANKRLDRKPIEVEVKGKKISTSRTALGAIIGDHSRIGIQVGFMPGKAVGAHSVIYPQQAVMQNLPHEGILK